MHRDARALSSVCFTSLLAGCTPADLDPVVTAADSTSSSSGVAGSTTAGPTTADSTTSDSTTADSTTSTPTTEPTGTTTDATTTDAVAASTDVPVSTDTSDTPDCALGEVKPCYTGPDGTEGVGQCAAGESICGDDQTWGPCVGETLPGRETCEGPADEDCDGLDACAGAGDHAWSKTWGGDGLEFGMQLGFDGAGNLVVAARGNSISDFGGGPLPSAGGYDLYLAKFGPDGGHLWSERFGDPEHQFINSGALAVAPAGDIIVGGAFKGSIDLGGGPLLNTGGSDAFLARLTGTGDHVWSKSFATGGALGATPSDVALDADGDIYLVGAFVDSVDFGGGDLVAAGDHDVFIARFSPAGDHGWSRRFGDESTDTAASVDTDAAGDVYVGGIFSLSIDFGLGPLQSAGDRDMFVARFSPDGQAIWANRYGGAEGQLFGGLVVDSKDRITFTGSSLGAVDFGGGPLPAPSLRGLVVRLDEAGQHVWSQYVADCTTESVTIAVDGFDSLLLTGRFQGSCDFGGGPLTSAGLDDIFTLKLIPGGEHVWSRSFGDANSQFGSAAAGSSAGMAAFSGHFRSTVDFGGGPANGDNTDGFVAVFNP